MDIDRRFFIGGAATAAGLGASAQARSRGNAGKTESKALKALTGRYDNDDRWAGPLYVYARDGALWIGNAERLTPLGPNEFRLGDETSPERIFFEGVINGRPHLLAYSGTRYVRRFS